MRPDQERFETELVAELPRRATRRGILSSAAKLAGGGALAVAFAGMSVGLASAQDDETDSDQRGGGGRRRGTRGGGGRRAGDAATADAPAAAADAPAAVADAPAAAADAPAGTGGALPGVGVGSTVRENSGSLAGLVGVAAAGAAALAVVSRRASVEGTAEV